MTTARQWTGNDVAGVIATRHFDSAPSPLTACEILREIAAKDCNPAPVQPRQPLVLYGGGDLGRLARDHLNLLDIPIAAIIDRNAEAIGSDPDWAGIPVHHPDDIDPSFKAQAMLAVSIVTLPFAPLQAALAASGWAHIVPFYDVAESLRDRHPLPNGWIAPPFEAADESEIAHALQGWDDDVSRAHHLQFIAWRRLRQEWTFAGADVTIHDRFFIPEIPPLLSDDEHYIDAGAYHGSITSRFIDERAGRFRAVTAIEPDPKSLLRLRQTIASELKDVAERITVVDALLDDMPQCRPFHDGLGYTSQIAASGRHERMSTTLDQLGLSATILKLHLEGHELPALKGAAATLAMHRPIVMATVYHDADGLHATARWLMRTLTRYRFLFRLHSWCGTGAVIYAIPEERG